jgi:glycerol-3-phosphate dehydrogenase (NAD(P)+)
VSQPQARVLTVVGAGSWGTALAIQAARDERKVVLTGRAADKLAEMAIKRCNPYYLPDIPFADSLTVAADFKPAIAQAEAVLISVPSHAFRACLMELAPLLKAQVPVAWATKGFEEGSGLLPHQVAQQVLGERPMAVLSGPTFAREVALGLPTAMTVASAQLAYAKHLATRLASDRFRVYTSDDVLGVELGGAVKNVIAIACGLADGLSLGANSRVALITRGLAELTRLGVALGAHPETLMGLAGLGDIVLTATDDQSRNRRFGLLLAQGLSASEAKQRIGQVVEGEKAALCVQQVATRLQLEMPISTTVYQILYEQLTIGQALTQLMRRELKAERSG